MKTKSIYNYLLNIQSPINNIDTLLTPILLASPFMEIAKKQDIINDSDLTIAKTAGLQDLLDTQTASIDSLIANGGGGSEFKPCFSCRPQGPQNFTNFSKINWGDVLFDDTVSTKISLHNGI